MSDQRQIRHHPASILRVTFEHPSTGERAEASVWDASLGGMFLETSAPLEEGALVALEITTAATKVSADARVLWRRTSSEGANQPSGMAVRFIDLPDDVSVALNRALQTGMADKTILGIGGATQEPTQPGIMPGLDVTPERVPRETQIGVAPPANLPGKPRLVISDTSLPETPAAPAVVAAREAKPATAPSPEESPKPRVQRRSAPSSEPPPPPGTGGGLLGRLLVLLVLAGAGGGLYLYRDRIAELLAGPDQAPSATPTTPLESATPGEPGDAALINDGASADAAAADGASADAAAAGGASADAAAATAMVTDAAADDDAAAHDAGHADAGRTDAGARDAGARDAGRASGAGSARHDAGRSPKHP